MKQLKKRKINSYVKLGGGLDFNIIARDNKQKKLIDENNENTM